VEIVFGAADQFDFPDKSFDVVFSQQVLEHVHPDDVPRHFSEGFRVLRQGGMFAVETPNRRTGPQDVSRGFVPVAEGLHLKEWTVRELIGLFRRAGFTKLRGLLAPPAAARRSSALHRWSRVPAQVKVAQDLFLSLVPRLDLRSFVGRLIGLDDVFIFGRKPS
jgi:SAM-dependent methyltransferase